MKTHRMVASEETLRTEGGRKPRVRWTGDERNSNFRVRVWPIWGFSLFNGFRETPRSGQCRPKFPESVGNHPVPDPNSPLLLGHQTGLEQDLEMVAHRGLRTADRLDKITSAHLAALGGADQRKKSQSGGIGQCRKCSCKSFRRSFVQRNLGNRTATDRRCR